MELWWRLTLCMGENELSPVVLISYISSFDVLACDRQDLSGRNSQHVICCESGPLYNPSLLSLGIGYDVRLLSVKQ